MTPRRHAKLFPLVLLALLGGLSFWLQSLTDWLSADVRHNKDAATPDYVVEGFAATVFDAQGGVKQRLEGQRAWQLPENPAIHLQGPHLRQYRQGVLQLEIIGTDGRYNPKTRISEFPGPVTLLRYAPGLPTAKLVTSRLTVDTEKRTAQSPAPAVLERGASVVRATGFTYNDATQQVQLLSKVKVTHVPIRH